MGKNYSFPVYDLTALYDAEGVECYTYMLNEALKREHIRNIAIAGRYGAGKSSFLNTFFKLRKSEKGLSWKGNKLRKKEKVLKISMAAFLEKEGGGKLDNVRERLLEFSILQQMFYHVTQSKLPFSRFRRLTRFSWKSWSPSLLYFLSLCLSLIFIGQPQSMIQRLSPIFVSAMTDIVYWIGIFLFTIVVAVGIVLLLCFYKKIKHCNLNFQNIELVIKKEDETSVFNQYMDEVVYFFEETEYTIVLFEDIDRFKDVQIFAKLRELNLILNSAKQIKQKPIRFIYALRDNMFEGTERVKFFDFILPIVPIIDAKSSAAKFKEMLTEYVGADKITEYDEMIHALSPYISDMRLMNNIVNEFATYREMISTQGNGLKFLGMVIFKNFFPAEFAKLYERTDSLLTRVIDRKKEIVREKIKELDSEVESVKAVIEMSDSEKFDDISELQSLYMVRCVGNKISRYATMIKWEGQSEINIGDFFASPNLFDSLFGMDFEISHPNYGSNPFTWTDVYSQVKKQLGDYKERVKAIEDKAQSKRKEYNQRIEKLVKEKNAIYRLSLSEMIKKGWLGPDDIKAILNGYHSKSELEMDNRTQENVIKHETILLLYQLFYGDYVGENYAHFISVFKTGDITRGDNDFETAVLEDVEYQFDYELENPMVVADHLSVGLFTKPAVRNFTLIEAMIKAREQYKDKLDAFASKFLSNTVDNQTFAIAFMSWAFLKDSDVSEIVEFYVAHWKTCLEDLFKGGNVTEELKEKLTEATLRWINRSHETPPLEIMGYISTAKHPCKIFKRAGYNPEAMANFLNKAGMLLTNCVFESEDEKMYVDAVRGMSCYSYENGMLERLMEASGIDISNWTYAPITCVRNSGLSDVIEDVNLNFDHFIKTFYAEGMPKKEDELQVVLDVINNEAFEIKDRETFITAQKRQIEDMELIKNDNLSKSLLLANMITPSWKNVVHAAERFTYCGEVQEFLEKNQALLDDQDWQPFEGSLQKWVDWLISTDAIPKDSLKDALKLFPESIKLSTLTKVNITAERLRVALECGRIRFSPELYEQFRKVGMSGHMDLAETYPSEFIQASKTNGWAMHYSDLIRIFTGNQFSDNQKCEVLKLFENGVRNDGVAKAAATFLTKGNYKKFSTSVLDEIFKHITQSDLQVLVLQRLNPDTEKIKNMIAKMQAPYNQVLDAKQRKTLPLTSLNKSFIKFLSEKGLIAD